MVVVIDVGGTMGRPRSGGGGGGGGGGQHVVWWGRWRE